MPRANCGGQRLFDDDLKVGAGALESEQASRDVAAAIRTIPGLATVTTSASLRRPEVLATRNLARAADLVVSTVEITEPARIATSGDLRHRFAKLNLAERQMSIRVQLADTSVGETSVIERLRVPGVHGSVPPSAVATISGDSG